jgi:hypothetical protein
LTKQQFDKVDEVMRLFSLDPVEMPKQAPYVKYVLVRAANIQRKSSDEYTYAFFGTEAPRLATALLLGPPSAVPPQYHLIDLVRFEMTFDKPETITYAKLYKIEASASRSSSDVSANEVSK